MPFQNQIGVLLLFLYKFMVQIYEKLGEEGCGKYFYKNSPFPFFRVIVYISINKGIIYK